MRISQTFIWTGALVGLAGAGLYLASAAGVVPFKEVEVEHPLETSLFVALLGTPYLLALWGAMVAPRRLVLGPTALGVAAVCSFGHVMLAAFSVVGLVFLVAATLLTCGAVFFLAFRPRLRAGAAR
ncbi:MAG TPA: hypothetical protein VNM43_07450 [Dehalococcoidia bacterium]|nr:hypothetical protein [Dehalococcoidia bacterium]